MKTTHWVALSAVGFLVGAAFLSMNRSSGGAGNPQTREQQTPQSSAGVSVVSDRQAEALRNVAKGDEAQKRKDFDLSRSPQLF
jgi:hypothetical protein